MHNDNVERLKQTVADREQDIQILLETASIIGSELQLDAVFNRVVRYVQRLIDCDTALLITLDASTRHYTYQAGTGPHAEALLGQTVNLDNNLCGWVIRQRRPWWSGVLDELSAAERSRWQTEAGNQLLVPLQGREGFLGVIAAISKRSGTAFNRRDLGLMQLLSHQVANAVDNAIAYARLAEEKERAQRYQHELVQMNAELERRVFERTEQLEHMALYDHLTGLPNRAYLMQRMQDEIRLAESQDIPLSIVMLDLDKFKEVNDTYGHQAGDTLLQETTARLRAQLRAGDFAARLGGDEFAMILPKATAAQAVAVVRRILAASMRPLPGRQQSLPWQGSFGIAAYPEHGLTAEQLLEKADAAMYEAKRNQTGVCLCPEETLPGEKRLQGKA